MGGAFSRKPKGAQAAYEVKPPDDDVDKRAYESLINEVGRRGRLTPLEALKQRMANNVAKDGQDILERAHLLHLRSKALDESSRSQGVDMLVEAYTLRVEAFGRNHPMVLHVQVDLAELLAELGSMVETAALLHSACDYLQVLKVQEYTINHTRKQGTPCHGSLKANDPRRIHPPGDTFLLHVEALSRYVDALLRLGTEHPFGTATTQAAMKASQLRIRLMSTAFQGTFHFSNADIATEMDRLVDIKMRRGLTATGLMEKAQLMRNTNTMQQYLQAWKEQQTRRATTQCGLMVADCAHLLGFGKAAPKLTPKSPTRAGDASFDNPPQSPGSESVPEPPQSPGSPATPLSPLPPGSPFATQKGVPDGAMRHLSLPPLGGAWSPSDDVLSAASAGDCSSIGLLLQVQLNSAPFGPLVLRILDLTPLPALTLPQQQKPDSRTPVLSPLSLELPHQQADQQPSLIFTKVDSRLQRLSTDGGTPDCSPPDSPEGYLPESVLRSLTPVDEPVLPPNRLAPQRSSDRVVAFHRIPSNEAPTINWLPSSSSIKRAEMQQQRALSNSSNRLTNPNNSKPTTPVTEEVDDLSSEETVVPLVLR